MAGNTMCKGDIQLNYKNMATINQTLRRAKEEGLGISETALRRWVKEGQIHAVFAGKKALIYWPTLMKFLCGEDMDSKAG